MMFCVLQQMFVKFQGAKNQEGFIRQQKHNVVERERVVSEARARGEDPPVKDDSLVAEDMPENCFFSGHFTLVLFGPKGMAPFTLAQVAVDDKKTKNESRKEQRKRKKRAKEAERQKT